MEKEKNIINNGELIFEGEYLNGKRNGKGEEYEHGKIKFKEKEKNMISLET